MLCLAWMWKRGGGGYGGFARDGARCDGDDVDDTGAGGGSRILFDARGVGA